MNLSEAKQILKNAGYLIEDTDEWDEADMPIGTPTQRKKMVATHNDAHKRLWDKKYAAPGLWVIRVTAEDKDDDGDYYDKLLGWLTPEFKVVKDVNKAIMNYDQVDAIFQKYIDYWEKPTGKLKEAIISQFGKLKGVYTEPGTFKKGKFFHKNIGEGIDA